jgi:hypothetical protein
MRYSITSAVSYVAKVRFTEMLKAGSFPAVNYKTDGRGYSYNMIDYATTWATFIKVLDIRIIEKNLDTRLGVFSRQRSAQFLSKVKELADNIAEADVFAQSERFDTIFD